jgi:hypothetical protein
MPSSADGAGGAVVQDPDRRGHLTAGVQPQVHGRRLEVAAVQFGIGALLLDDEHIHPQPAQCVHLERRQFGERLSPEPEEGRLVGAHAAVVVDGRSGSVADDNCCSMRSRVTR